MEVSIHLEKIKHNISIIQDISRKAGLQTVWVTKGCHSHPAIICALDEMGAEIVGEVYPSNLQRISKIFSGDLMMIHFPALSQARETVACTDINLVSSLEHTEALSRAAEEMGKQQRIIMMVDVGNLREGVMPKKVLSTVRKILPLRGVELIGLGTSVGCYGGYLAEERDLHQLEKITKETEEASGHRFQVLSAGSGTMLFELIRNRKLPERINQMRIGAALLVGEKPPTKEPIYPLHQDCFIFSGEILEMDRKPSLPSGRTGFDAFGRKVTFEDMGERMKVLLNFGMVDVDIYNLTPRTPGVKIIGGTSNYTICDIHDCPEKFWVGKCLDFRMGYSAMTRAMSSVYVLKKVV
ncbi:MAG: alanine racemase [Pseudomonadota bacterium]